MEKSRRFWGILTLLYMLAILWSSTVPGSSHPTEGFSKRGFMMNLLHIPAYSILTYFLLRAAFAVRLRTQGSGPCIPLGSAFVISAVVFAAAVCFGVLNEFVQAHVPGREFSIGDMLRNALGAGLTLFFYKNKSNKKMSS